MVLDFGSYNSSTFMFFCFIFFLAFAFACGLVRMEDGRWKGNMFMFWIR